MAWKVDEHKIFIGSLNSDINKPQLLTLFESLGLQPYDVIVPTTKTGQMAIAFAIFNTNWECGQAIQMLHGGGYPKYSPIAMTAHRGDPSGESLGL